MIPAYFQFSEFRKCYLPNVTIFQSHEKANTQTNTILTLGRLTVCIFVQQIYSIYKIVSNQTHLRRNNKHKPVYFKI